MATHENKEELNQMAGFLFFQWRSSSKKKKGRGELVFRIGRWAGVATSENKMLTRFSPEGRAGPEHRSIFVPAHAQVALLTPPSIPSAKCLCHLQL